MEKCHNIIAVFQDMLRHVAACLQMSAGWYNWKTCQQKTFPDEVHQEFIPDSPPFQGVFNAADGSKIMGYICKSNYDVEGTLVHDEVAQFNTNSMTR